MKFFRQTKETKRKLSFFLALAMVISLLPVSPVAKAETKEIAFKTSIAGVYVEKAKENTSIASGSAVVTLKVSDNSKIGKTITDLGVAHEADVTSTTKASIAVSPAAMGKGTLTVESKEVTIGDNGTAEVIVKNIIDSMGTITITGSWKSDNPTDPVKPAEKVNVTLNSNNLCAGVTLSATAGDVKIASGATVEVNKNSTVTITVEPTDKSAVWDGVPTIKAGNTSLNWSDSRPVLTATTTVTGDTTITVSGGELFVVSNEVTTNTIPTTITDNDTKNEIGNSVSLGNIAERTELIQDILDNVPSELKNEIKKILGGKADITTSLGVQKTSEDSAKSSKNKVTSTNVGKIKGVTDAFGKTADEKQKTIKSLVDNGVVLDIELTSVITYLLDGKTTSSSSIEMKELSKPVSVTMNIPKTLRDKYDNKTGVYYVIRIHHNNETKTDEIEIIPCSKNDKEKTLTFESNKFSTYIVTFNEGDTTPTPTPGNNNGYIPGPGQSTAPSANPSTAPSTNPSANPSGAPSANPSGAPSANPSSTPSANPSGAPTDPTNAPTEPTKAPTNPTKKPSTSVKVGKKATISGSQYKVTAVKGTRTVQFTKGKKNAKKIVIPSTVKVSGKSYKVTTIAKNALKGNKKLTKLTIGANVTKIGANAFRGCSKLKSIIVKTKKLTKSKVGSNAFKGINAKATVKVPKAKVKAYKKIVKAKGAGKNVKVKK